MSCSRGGPRLNVFNWSSYVAPDTISNFEKETGIQVRYGTYESTPEMLAKVMGGNSGWDVVFPSAEYLQPMRDLGLLSRLDASRLSNLDALDSAFQRPPWDPELQWCIPYMFGTTGIVFQKQLAVSRWQDLWEPRLAGHITMLEDPPEVLGACLKILGFGLNSSAPDELRAAQAKAQAQKPLVRAYLNAEVADQLVAGDVGAAQAWSVTAAQAMMGAPGKLQFVLPIEGFARYADNASILKETQGRGAARVDAAHRFLNYLLRPKVAADIAIAMRTATCNRGAQKLLPDELSNDPVLYPPASSLERGEWFTPQSAAGQRLRDRLWTELKSA
jgi:spermidine/putrescine transport system substrate-binding protein